MSQLNPPPPKSFLPEVVEQCYHWSISYCRLPQSPSYSSGGTISTSSCFTGFTQLTLMEINEFSELFPVFNTASPETLEWFLSVAVEEEYPEDSVIISTQTWGRAVYFILSGWVKVQRLDEEKVVALEILGKGGFVGEMAILDEPPHTQEVVALFPVKLMVVSAQRFIQTLYKDSQIQQRMLQLMARRLRQAENRWQMRHKLPKIKLVKVLLDLAENYGRTTEKGTKICNMPEQDLAEIADITLEETDQILQKLQTKGWLEIDNNQRALYLTNFRQLTHLIGQI